MGTAGAEDTAQRPDTATQRLMASGSKAADRQTLGKSFLSEDLPIISLTSWLFIVALEAFQSHIFKKKENLTQ